jgi:hypothetical protein
MSNRIPIEHLIDLNGRPIAKLLDLFETVRIAESEDMSITPNYYADIHPTGYFMVREYSLAANVYSMKFYFGTPSQDLDTVFAGRAGLTYLDLTEVFS